MRSEEELSVRRPGARKRAAAAGRPRPRWALLLSLITSVVARDRRDRRFAVVAVVVVAGALACMTRETRKFLCAVRCAPLKSPNRESRVCLCLRSSSCCSHLGGLGLQVTSIEPRGGQREAPGNQNSTTRNSRCWWCGAIPSAEVQPRGDLEKNMAGPFSYV